MEKYKSEKVSFWRKPFRRLAALALAAALALGLAACDGASVLPGGSADVIPNPASSGVQTADSFRMHFLDVGQALSVLVECDGQYMLYDGGNVDDGSLVVSYLQQQGVEELQYVFCSHAHEDHVGGLAAVVDAVPVGQAIVSPVTADSDYYKDFLDALADRGVTPVAGQAGMQFPLGDAKCTVLGPAAAGSDLNNSSLVLQVRFGGATFLFMGDAGAEEERSLIQSGADVSCDVLAVGHHGSGSATGYVFLRQALPKYAVISVGAGNRYGHPAESTLSRLRDAGCTVYRTDQSGTITIVTDKNGKIRCPA